MKGRFCNRIYCSTLYFHIFVTQLTNYLMKFLSTKGRFGL